MSEAVPCKSPFSDLTDLVPADIFLRRPLDQSHAEKALNTFYSLMYGICTYNITDKVLAKICIQIKMPLIICTPKRSSSIFVRNFYDLTQILLC